MTQIAERLRYVAVASLQRVRIHPRRLARHSKCIQGVVTEEREVVGELRVRTEGAVSNTLTQADRSQPELNPIVFENSRVQDGVLLVHLRLQQIQDVSNISLVQSEASVTPGYT